MEDDVSVGALSRSARSAASSLLKPPAGFPTRHAVLVLLSMLCVCVPPGVHPLVPFLILSEWRSSSRCEIGEITELY